MTDIALCCIPQARLSTVNITACDGDRRRAIADTAVVITNQPAGWKMNAPMLIVPVKLQLLILLYSYIDQPARHNMRCLRK